MKVKRLKEILSNVPDNYDVIVDYQNTGQQGCYDACVAKECEDGMFRGTSLIEEKFDFKFEENGEIGFLVSG